MSRTHIARRDPGELARFQDAFAAALLAPLNGVEVPILMRELVEQPGFAIHRNTVIKGCVDALVDAFPTITRLVGEEWMRAACAIHASESLPRSPLLLDYGSSFAGFLARFEPAQQLPYLPGVARMDRAWIEAHAAADWPPLEAGALAVNDGGWTERSRLAVHPSLRVVTCIAHPIHTIWLRNREDHAASGTPIDWKGESALVVRRDGVVCTHPLDPAALALLGACLAGATLEQCVQAALDIDPECKPAAILHSFYQRGALVAQRTTA